MLFRKRLNKRFPMKLPISCPMKILTYFDNFYRFLYFFQNQAIIFRHHFIHTISLLHKIEISLA